MISVAEKEIKNLFCKSMELKSSTLKPERAVTHEGGYRSLYITDNNNNNINNFGLMRFVSFVKDCLSVF